MKLDVLKEFASLRAALEKERDQLQQRLDAINAVLAGQSTEAFQALTAPARKQKRGRPKTSDKADMVTKPKKRGPRKMSETAKARIAAAQRERWEKIRAQKAAAAGGVTPPSAAEPPAPSPQG